MNCARRSSRGFTLVEILIVVIILGALAAIIVPHVANAASDARRTSIASQVQSLRCQIAVYKVEHGGEIPDLVTDWTALTQAGTFNGNTTGPYMTKIPTNTLNTSTVVVDGTDVAPAGSACGFVYDYNGGAGSGRIWATDIDGTTIILP